MEWAPFWRSFPHSTAAAPGAPAVPNNTREAFAPSVRCLEGVPCRPSFHHSTAAALGAQAVPEQSERSDTRAQAASVQSSARSCLSFSTAASRKLHKVLGRVVRFEADHQSLCPSLNAVSKTLLRAARALRQRPLAEVPVPCHAEDVSCPPFQHSMHPNRSSGAQVCQKDASFPSAAQGANGGTAASGQAQVDPSPLGPTEDVSFPPQCCSALSGKPSGMQFPRKTEPFRTSASSAVPPIPDSLQESCARAEDVSCPPARYRLHSNRSPGAQVYQKDASSPSAAQGANGMAAVTGQAQVNPSPLGPAEDVSFPPLVPFPSQCRSVLSGKSSGVQAEDVSCPPARYRLHSNRSPGAQVYQKDASSPSAAPGANGMAAVTGQAQVNPSPLGPAEDVSFPPLVPFPSQCRSVLSGKSSGVQPPRKTEPSHILASGAALPIPDSLEESCARAEDVSCPPAHYSMPFNRSPGAQVYQKDASSPSAPQGANGIAAAAAQAQVDPSPFGPAEDVSFPSLRRSVLSGRFSGMQARRKTVPSHTSTSGAVLPVIATSKESRAVFGPPRVPPVHTPSSLQPRGVVVLL